MTPQQVGYSTHGIIVDCDCEGLSVRLACCSEVAGAARGAQRLHARRMVIKPLPGIVCCCWQSGPAR